MVVDDSVVVRRLVSDILDQDPDLEVVGTAANGRIALAKLDTLRPDVVTMDIEMPELDGVETVRQMRKAGSTLPVIMFSTLTDRGAAATLDALAAGATDYVTKPANVGSVGRSMEQVRTTLVPKIKALAPRRAALPGARPALAGQPAPAAPSASGTRPAAPGAVRLATRTSPVGGYKILVVGSSTGGPEALTQFLTALPPLPVPVAIVQHMPAMFTRQFAARLDRQLGSPVTETVTGQRLEPGSITVAPGDFHLHLTGTKTSPVARLSQEAPENYCRPAVDVLFRTAAQVYGRQVLGVILTGMGQDGCRGSRAVVEAGGSVIAQDQATSVVWGMPGAVATAGLAEEVLPLPSIAAAVAQRLAASFVAGAR